MTPKIGSRPVAARPPTDQVPRTAGRYLLELYLLSLDADDRIGTGRLADRLDVRPASVTEMVSHLDEAELIDHRKHHGVVLTDRGVAVGEALAWRYCVVEEFFQSVLDTALNRSTAYEVGYHLPDDGVVTLGEKLGIPCMRACESIQQRGGAHHQPTAQG